MKKIILASALAFGTGAVVLTSVQSCAAVATSNIGLAIIKQILLGGISHGLNIFSDKNAFMRDQLIDQALPSQLRSLNNMLEKVAPSLVAKEKEYIAEAASYTVSVAQPVLTNAVNNLNAGDVNRIIGGTTATQILKEKAASQLASAIYPKVDEKLNQFGIVRTINMAFQSSNMIGSIFGNQQSAPSANGLSQFASEQMVNGLFMLIENYEKSNSSQIRSALGR